MPASAMAQPWPPQGPRSRRFPGHIRARVEGADRAGQRDGAPPSASSTPRNRQGGISPGYASGLKNAAKQRPVEAKPGHRRAARPHLLVGDNHLQPGRVPVDLTPRGPDRAHLAYAGRGRHAAAPPVLVPQGTVRWPGKRSWGRRGGRWEVGDGHRPGLEAGAQEDARHRAAALRPAPGPPRLLRDRLRAHPFGKSTGSSCWRRRWRRIARGSPPSCPRARAREVAILAEKGILRAETLRLPDSALSPVGLPPRPKTITTITAGGGAEVSRGKGAGPQGLLRIRAGRQQKLVAQFARRRTWPARRARRRRSPSPWIFWR
jgi:hypothetical protein